MSKEIEEALVRFTERVTAANYYQSSIDRTISKQLAELYTVRGTMTDESCEKIVSVHNLMFPHLKTGVQYVAGSTEHNVNSKIHDLYNYHNRQNQWILAEVYEAFEIFLTDFFAIVGYRDSVIWKENELPSKELRNSMCAYYKQIKIKKITPRKIMNKLSQHLPEVKAAESINTFKKINIRFAISVIENFRHLIVHKHGVINDKQAFVDKVLRESGVSIPNDGKLCCLSFIDYYLGKGDYSNHILLLKRSVESDFPLAAYKSRLGDFFSILLSYTHFIVESYEAQKA